MASEKHTRTYINPTKAFPESVQRDGVGREPVYVENKTGKMRDRWIADLRPGNVAKVMHLALLAKPRTAGVDVYVDLHEAIQSIEAKGAVILEWATGRRSDDKAQMLAMIFDATTALRKGRRGHNAEIAGRAGGRPKFEFTEAQLEAMEAAWSSRRIRTNEEAVERLHAKGIKVSRSSLYKMFGASGRRPKPRRK